MIAAMGNVETDIILVPAVNAALVNGKGQVLLTRRSQAIREPGKWCLPGGHIDGGEDFKTAIVREIQEEMGVTITEYELMGIYSDPALTVIDKANAQGKKTQFLVVCFLVTKWEGEFAPNYEVDKWGWFAPHEIPEPILKSHPIRVHDAINYTGKVFVR